VYRPYRGYNRYLGKRRGSMENENNTEEIIGNANDNIGEILYIMLGRVYDLLVLMCDANGKSEEVLRIMELHKNGMLMCPLPSLSIPEE
jgi:hypothetical protein